MNNCVILLERFLDGRTNHHGDRDSVQSTNKTVAKDWRKITASFSDMDGRDR